MKEEDTPDSFDPEYVDRQRLLHEVWTTKEGSKVIVKDLTEEHAKACLGLMLRNLRTGKMLMASSLPPKDDHPFPDRRPSFGGCAGDSLDHL
jgi:hypothetical protein